MGNVGIFDILEKSVRFRSKIKIFVNKILWYWEFLLFKINDIDLVSIYVIIVLKND